MGYYMVMWISMVFIMLAETEYAKYEHCIQFRKIFGGPSMKGVKGC